MRAYQPRIAPWNAADSAASACWGRPPLARVQQHRQARHLGQSQPRADVDGAERQHAGRQRGHAQPGHDGRRDRRHAAADEDLAPRHRRLVQPLGGQRAHAAGFGERGQRQRLVRAVLPVRRREPAQLFLGQHRAVVAAGVQARDHGVQLPPVIALQQVARGADADFDQEFGILRVHARDQRGQLRAGHMVADADGQALPRFDRQGERALMRRHEFPGVFEKTGAARRQLHVAGRALDQPETEPVFEPLELQADRGLRHAQRIRCQREAAQLGDADEGLDGVQVQRALIHFEP